MALLTDSSTNNFQLSAFGNAVINESIFKYGGGSAYFDGNGDYLEIPASATITGTEDFTIECWVYPLTLTPSSGYTFIYGFKNESPNGNFSFGYTTGGFLFTATAWQGIDNTANTQPLILNQWNHIAFTRTGGILRGFVNGQQCISVSNNNNYPSGKVGAVGGDYGGNPYFNGYIDDLRITKGVARYTANFTPPTQQLPAPSDQYGENVSLLLHMDGTDGSTDFTDSSTNNFTLTAYGNAQIDTSIKKFGSGAAYFDGSGDYIVAPTNNNFSFTDDFTVEFWLYPLSFATDMALFDNQVLNGSGSRSNAIVLLTNTSGRYYLFTNGSIIATSSSGPILNQWNHVALKRSGGTIRVLNNGSEVLDVNNSTQFTAGGCVIGTISDVPGNPSYGLNGYIDELRISKGIARYTSNFVPQTAPFANPTPIE